MSMIRVGDIEAQIFQAIPSIIEFEGKQYTFQKKYGNQFDWKSSPSIVLTYGSNENADNSISREALSNKWEEHKFDYHTGTLTYNLHKDHVTTIDWVYVPSENVKVAPSKLYGTSPRLVMYILTGIPFCPLLTWVGVVSTFVIDSSAFRFTCQTYGV